MLRKKLAHSLDVPESSLLSGSEICITENGELTINGEFTLLGFCDTEITLSLKKHILTVLGQELYIIGISSELLELGGTILSVSMSRKDRGR